jgi:hypothetical protein
MLMTIPLALILPEWPAVIGASVVPVVIISACGLLSLAYYNRLATVVSRLRVFQREMLREQERIREEAPNRPQKLLEVLHTQTQQMTKRARLIRRALWFLMLAVVLQILSSLLLLLSWFERPVAIGAGVLFFFGLVSMLAGVISAMVELRSALQPVELEAQFVSETIQHTLSEDRTEGI